MIPPMPFKKINMAVTKGQYQLGKDIYIEQEFEVVVIRFFIDSII
jgi:hypothetical protein